MMGFLLLWTSAFACTAFQLRSEDGAILYCRSMEFGLRMNSDLLIVPRQTSFTGTAPEGTPGKKWVSKYGYIGMNQAFARTLVSDGMNEQGLVVGMLYLPGFAKYETPDSTKQDQTLGPWELSGFLLSTCKDLHDVQAVLPTLLVAQQPVPGLGDFVIPLHYYISDKSGDVIVVEYVDGKRNIHRNPLHALTNSPTFDWHLINLGNFTHLSPINVPPLQISDYTIRGFGQGSGLLGIPGDYTPPSRFVKAVFFSNWADKQKTASEGVRQGFHLLNTFDIVEGLVKSSSKGNYAELTEWALIHDMTNLQTYFRTYDSLQIQKVDLNKIDFKTPGFRKIDLKKEFGVIDSTDTSQPLPNPAENAPLPLKTS